jgi:hypothetical protein
MPRIKTYSAASGFVYQYQFASHKADETGDYYVFQTTQDRRSAFSVTVLLQTRAVADWEAQTARTLSPTEKYALAKIALFTAFDDAGNPELLPQPVTVDTGQLQAIARMLDL